MFVCCVLSGRGLCDELITRPEESYRLWCVVVCDLENLKNEVAMTRVGSQRHKKKSYPFTTQWKLCELIRMTFRSSTFLLAHLRVPCDSVNNGCFHIGLQH